MIEFICGAFGALVLVVSTFAFGYHTGYNKACDDARLKRPATPEQIAKLTELAERFKRRNQ